MEFTLSPFFFSISSGILYFLLSIALLAWFTRNSGKSDNYSFSDIETIDEDGVAVLNVTKPILNDPDGFSSPRFMKRKAAVFGREVEEALIDLADNPNIKGVVIKFDTPGGTIPGSKAIARGIEYCREKKPVFAHIIGLSASGGVMSMVPATLISAEESTMIGSVGVRGPTLFYYSGVKSIGSGILGKSVEAEEIESETLSIGKGKSLGDPFAPKDEEAIESYRELLERAYDGFKSHIYRYRSEIENGSLEEIGARMLDARQAVDFGFIDMIDTERNIRESIADKIGVSVDDCKFLDFKPGSGSGSALSFSIKETLLALSGNVESVSVASEFRNMPVSVLWNGYRF